MRPLNNITDKGSMQSDKTLNTGEMNGGVTKKGTQFRVPFLVTPPGDCDSKSVRLKRHIACVSQSSASTNASLDTG